MCFAAMCLDGLNVPNVKQALCFLFIRNTLAFEQSFGQLRPQYPIVLSHISAHARALCYQYAPLLGVYKPDPKEILFLRKVYFICYLNSIPDGIISEQAELYKTRDCRGGRQKSNGEAVLGTSIESWRNLLEVERRLGTWR